MIRLIKNEWRKIGKPVIFTVAILSIAFCILSCTLYKNYSLVYDLEAWEVGTSFGSLLFPLFVVIPICHNMYYERKNSFLLYTLPRLSKKKYLAAKWATYAISAFCIIFIPYLLCAVFSLFVKPPITPWEREFDHVFMDIFANTPMMYAFLLSLWRGFVGVLVMSLGFVLSLYVDNIFVILTGPFIYGILENFILSILSVPEYRLVTAFDPTVVVSERISALSFVVGPGLVCILIFFLWLYLGKIKSVSVYKM